MSILLSVIFSVILSLFFTMFLIAKDRKKHNFNRYASIANVLDKKIETISKYEVKVEKYRDMLATIPKEIDKLTDDYQNLGSNRELLNNCSKTIAKMEERLNKLSTDYKKLSEELDKNNSEASQKQSLKEIKSAKIDIANGLKEFDKKSKEIMEELKRGGTQYVESIDERKKSILKDIISHKEYVKELVNSFQLEYAGLAEIVADFKSELVNNTNKELNELMGFYNGEISNIKESIRTEENNFDKKVDEKVKDIGDYITKVEVRAESFKSNIDKSLSKLKDSYILDIRESHSKVTEELKNYNEKLKSNILKELKDSYDEHDKQSSELYSKIGNIDREISEKQILTEKLIDSLSEKIETIKMDALNELTKKLEEFNFYIESASDRGVRLEFDIFNKVRADLNNFELEVNEKWSDYSKDLDDKLSAYRDVLKSKYDLMNLKIDDLDEMVAKSINELDSYREHFKLLEDETSNKIELLKSSFDEVNENIDGRYEALYRSFDEKRDSIEKELLNDLNNVRLDIDKHIENLNEHFSKESEKIVENIDSSMSAISNDANSKTNDIIARFENQYSLYEKKLIDISESIDKKTLAIENEIFEKSDSIDSKIKDRMEHIEAILLDRQAGFEMDIKDISLNYETKFKSFAEKIGKAMKNSEDRTLSKMEETYKQISHFDKEVNNYIKGIGGKFKKMEDDYTHLEARIKERESSFQYGLEDKIIKFEENYLKKSGELFKDSEIRFNQFITEFDNLENTLKSLKSNFAVDLNSKIENQKNNLDEFFNLGRENLSNHYEKLEESIITRIELYRREFIDLKEIIKNYEADFNSHFNEQMQKYDLILSEKLESSDEVYRDSLDLFLKQSNDAIITNNTRIDEFLSKVDFIDKKLGDFDKLLSNDFEEIIRANRENLVKKYSELENNSKLRLTGYKNEFDSLVSSKLADSKNEIDGFFKNEFNGLIIKYKKYENELLDRLGDFKKELFKMQQNLKTLDDKSTTRFMEHTNSIDRRIQEVAEHIKRLERQATSFEHVEAIRDKLIDDTRDLKVDVEQLKRTRDTISSVEKRANELTTMFSGFEEKYDSLLVDKDRVDNMYKSIGEIESLVNDLNKKIENVKESKEKLTDIENRIESANSKLETISNIYETASTKSDELNGLMDSFDEMKRNIYDMGSNFDGLNKKYDELDIKRSTFEKVIKNFEKEAAHIIKSGGHFGDILDKFKQMDHLIDDIDERTNTISRLREWLVKSETEIENMNRETDNRIRLLESLLDKASLENQNPIKEQLKDDGNKKKTILQLKEQGWVIDDIAKTLNVSIGEVEFVLNLGIGNARKK